MFSSTGESQTLPSTGLRWLQASSLRAHWKHTQKKTSLPPSSAISVWIYVSPCMLLGCNPSGLPMLRDGMLQPEFGGGSCPMQRIRYHQLQSAMGNVHISWWFGEEQWWILPSWVGWSILFPYCPSATKPLEQAQWWFRSTIPAPNLQDSSTYLLELFQNWKGSKNKESKREGKNPKALPFCRLLVLPRAVAGLCMHSE